MRNLQSQILLEYLLRVLDAEEVKATKRTEKIQAQASILHQQHPKLTAEKIARKVVNIEAELGKKPTIH